MKRTDYDASLRCSFCDSAQDAVGKLIANPSQSPRAFICDGCIALCQAIIDKERLVEKDASVADPEPPALSPVMASLAAFAKFSPQKMSKSTIAQGSTLFAGLNSFEPGQEHAAHAHEGQDKLYVVLQGEAEIQVGDEKRIVSQGGGGFAPSGIMHSIRNSGAGRLVVLAVLAPPPAK